MADDLKITTDVFLLPYNENEKILYAPLTGTVCTVNEDVINLLAEIEHLEPRNLNAEQNAAIALFKEKGIVNGPNHSVVRQPPQEYQPHMVTLFPTNQCNLRCIYCYASAGDEKPLVMEMSTAVSAIEYIIKNVKSIGMKQLSVGFHGGGEPLHPWRLIKNVVTYIENRAEEEKLEPFIYAATNGLLGEKQLEWILRHFKNLNISFDGLPHVQDYHRPLPNGRGSFEFLDRTLRYLDEHNFPYGLRGTVSEYNLELMEETIDFIGQNYSAKAVHLEPLFYCGRCKTKDALSPDMQRFAENFMKCEDRATEYGINLIYSGSHVDMLRNSFCGVSADNFSVTPDGYVTTCFECTTKTDPKSEHFFIGKLLSDGDIKIDEKKRKKLLSLTVDQLNYCEDCFAKWHCGGECAAKLEHNDLSGPRGHDRCLLNRALIENRLKRIVEGKPSPVFKKVTINSNSNQEDAQNG